MEEFKTPWWAGWLALALVLIGTLTAVVVWRMGFPASQGEPVSTSVTVPKAVMVEWRPQSAGWPLWQVAEDDPAWDCRTMGNRICGPSRG